MIILVLFIYRHEQNSPCWLMACPVGGFLMCEVQKLHHHGLQKLQEGKNPLPSQLGAQSTHYKKNLVEENMDAS